MPQALSETRDTLDQYKIDNQLNLFGF
jgi:hypothetical protein